MKESEPVIGSAKNEFQIQYNLVREDITVIRVVRRGSIKRQYGIPPDFSSKVKRGFRCDVSYLFLVITLILIEVRNVPSRYGIDVRNIRRRRVESRQIMIE
jgi:hypothetical protein